MVPDERIRELCVRVVTGQGAEFQAALMELKEAIDTRLGADETETKIGSRSEQA